MLDEWVFVAEFRCYTSSKEARYYVSEQIAYIKKDLDGIFRCAKKDRMGWAAQSEGHKWWWAIWEESLTSNKIRNFRFYSSDLEEIDQAPKDNPVIRINRKVLVEK